MIDIGVCVISAAMWAGIFLTFRRIITMERIIKQIIEVTYRDTIESVEKVVRSNESLIENTLQAEFEKWKKNNVLSAQIQDLSNRVSDLTNLKKLIRDEWVEVDMKRYNPENVLDKKPKKRRGWTDAQRKAHSERIKRVRLRKDELVKTTIDDLPKSYY